MPESQFLSSLVINKVDTVDTLDAMDASGLVNPNELYLVEEGDFSIVLDEQPTEGSKNLIASGAVKTYVDGVASNLVTEITPESIGAATVAQVQAAQNTADSATTAANEARTTAENAQTAAGNALETARSFEVVYGETTFREVQLAAEDGKRIVGIKPTMIPGTNTLYDIFCPNENLTLFYFYRIERDGEIRYIHLSFSSTEGDIWREGTISNSPYEVGDTLTTIRTNLGDKWLLCNGESFDDAIYPELAVLIPKDYTETWAVKTLENTQQITKVEYHDDVYVGIGLSNGYNTIFVSDNYEGPYTAVWTSNVSEETDGKGYIAYRAGLWCVVFQNRNTSKRVIYSTSPRDTWSVHTAVTTNTNMSVCGFGIDDSGNLYLLQRINTNANMFVAASPTSNWDNKYNWTDVNTISLAVGNGEVGFFVCYYDSYYQNYCDCVYLENLSTNQWGSVNINRSSEQNAQAISFVKDRWLVSVSGQFYTATSLSGPWTAAASGSAGGSIQEWGLKEGKYYGVVNSGSNSLTVYWSEDGSNWTGKSTELPTYQNLVGSRPGNELKITTINNDSPYQWYETYPAARLPSISTDKAYTYIKAKE